MTEGEKTAVYFADPAMSDVILIVGDKEFHVHKMILAARSKYFKALFYADFKEKDQKRIEIDADPVVFERLLQLNYNGRLKDTKFLQCKRAVSNDFWDAASALWAAFDRFDCEHARESFVEQLKTSICPKDEFASVYGGKITAQRCFGCADRFVFAAKHGIQFPKCSFQCVSGWFYKNKNLPPELQEMKRMFSMIELRY